MPENKQNGEKGADELLAIVQGSMIDLKEAAGRQQKTADETQIMVKGLTHDVSKMHGTVESMKEQASEDREKCADTSRHLAIVGDRVKTLRAAAPSSGSIPTVKEKNGWSLTPKQWALVAGIFIPAVYGAVEILIKIAKYME